MTQPKASVEELRDRAAELLGCTRAADGYIYAPANDARFPSLGHPLPLSLDSIAAAWPEGWRWTRTGLVWTAIDVHDPVRPEIEVPNTGNELYDFLSLLVAVLESGASK